MAFLSISGVLACRDKSSPTQPSGLEGAYVLTATESCSGGYSRYAIQVVQSGNEINFLLGVDTGGVRGTLQGQTIAFTWTKEVDAGLACGSDLTGVATIGGNTITGSVSGNSSARSCFTCPSDRIDFTLVRQ
jgi:hypothetical protein